MVEDTPIFNVGQRIKFLVIGLYYAAILAGDHPSESVKVMHSPLASENLTSNQP